MSTSIPSFAPTAQPTITSTPTTEPTSTPTTSVSSPVPASILSSGVAVPPPIPVEDIPDIREVNPDNFGISKAEIKEAPDEQKTKYSNSYATYIHNGVKSEDPTFILRNVLISHIFHSPSKAPGLKAPTNSIGITVDPSTSDGKILNDATEVVRRGLARAFLKFAQNNDLGKGIVGERSTEEEMLANISKIPRRSKDKKTMVVKPKSIPTWWVKLKTTKEGKIFTNGTIPTEHGPKKFDIEALRNPDFRYRVTITVRLSHIYKGFQDSAQAQIQWQANSIVFLGYEKKVTTSDLDAEVIAYARDHKDELAKIFAAAETVTVGWKDKAPQLEEEARKKREAEETQRLLHSSSSSAPDTAPNKGMSAFTTAPSHFNYSQHSSAPSSSYHPTSPFPPAPQLSAAHPAYPPSAYYPGPPTIPGAPPSHSYPTVPGMTPSQGR